MFISSASNSLYKYLKSLRQKKYRKLEQAVIIEGQRAIEQALDLGAELKYIVLREDMMNSPFDGEVIYLAQALFKKLSDTVNSQGVLAVVDLSKRATVSKDDNIIIVLDRVQDPGNLGTILRTAKAFAYSEIVLLKGTVDVYNPKVLRSALAATLSLNIRQDVSRDNFLAEAKAEGRQIVATALKNAQPLNSYQKRDKIALVFGNEANGIDEEILLQAEQKLYIPLEDFESLNVAISAGIFLYHLANL